VCSLSVATLSNTYSMVTVNGTTVFGPTTPFDSSTSATACDSAGTTASVGMYTTRN
jgi:predicted enzyme related to lactoylglutathione lyase